MDICRKCVSIFLLHDDTRGGATKWQTNGHHGSTSLRIGLLVATLVLVAVFLTHRSLASSTLNITMFSNCTFWSYRKNNRKLIYKSRASTSSNRIIFNTSKCSQVYFIQLKQGPKKSSSDPLYFLSEAIFV